MVKNLPDGCVLYVDVGLGFADHSGIYIGDNKIVHLNGSGRVCIVSPTKFLNRLNGWNTAMSIYVSCNGNTPVGSKEAANRALNKVGRYIDYNFLFNNCHQFTATCLNDDAEGDPMNFLWILKMEASTYLNADSWRVWDRQ